MSTLSFPIAADAPPYAGEMAARVRSHDWSKTPLGPIQNWPPSLRLIVDIMLVSGFPMAVRYGPDFVLIYNDGYRPILGEKHPAALGLPFRQAWPEVQPRLGQLHEDILAGTNPGLFSEDLPLNVQRHGDRWEEARFTVSYSPIPDPTAPTGVGGVLITAVETTERVRMEAALRDAEAALRTSNADLEKEREAVSAVNRQLAAETETLRGLFEQAPGFMVVLTGPEHVFTLANSSYMNLVGDRELLGKSVREALPELAGQGFIELLNNVYARGQPYVGRAVRTLIQQTPDGAVEERLLDFVYQPIVGADGAVTGIFRAGPRPHRADAGRSRVAGERAALSPGRRERPGHAVDGRRSREVRLSQRRPTRVLGFERGRCRNLRLEQQPAAGRCGDALRAFRPCYGDPHAIRRRSALSARRRRHPPAADRCPARFGANGEFLGMIGVNVDVTERRLAEQALHDLNATLEHQVQERTAQLRAQEEELRQSQKMEAVGQLTGGVAHDFNNLLQVIVGNLETLQRNLAPEETRLRRAADNAMNGARRATTLTQRLLAFSRRQPLAPKPIKVNDLVNGMSELLYRSLGETIAIETVLAAGVWRTHADPNQLESALLNLAVNARDAMPNGGKLTIETANAHIDEGYASKQAEVSPGQYVVICVSDTGTGMDKVTIARVFEPFFTTKEPGKGTGLGLSQVYGFVKQSGGHVKIYSEQDQGTTVKIYLLVCSARTSAMKPRPNSWPLKARATKSSWSSRTTRMCVPIPSISCASLATGSWKRPTDRPHCAFSSSERRSICYSAMSCCPAAGPAHKPQHAQRRCVPTSRFCSRPAMRATPSCITAASIPASSSSPSRLPMPNSRPRCAMFWI